MPLYVRPANMTAAAAASQGRRSNEVAEEKKDDESQDEEGKSDEDDEGTWTEGFDYEVNGGSSNNNNNGTSADPSDSATANNKQSKNKNKKPDEAIDSTSEENKEETDAEAERTGIWKAAQLYLECPLELRNVAHAMVPIRRRSDPAGVATRSRTRAEEATSAEANASSPTTTGPQLEVDMIFHNSTDDEEEEPVGSQTGDWEGDPEDPTCSRNVFSSSTSGGATMILVRMVNRIPLLDSSEAVACGLVQGMASKKQLWNSFGLDVSLRHDPGNVTKIPTFSKYNNLYEPPAATLLSAQN